MTRSRLERPQESLVRVCFMILLDSAKAATPSSCIELGAWLELRRLQLEGYPVTPLRVAGRSWQADV